MNSIRVKVQQLGRFLSGMVMPNIGAFIAWGLITALFIPTGWWPNENLVKLVGPMITYLLPLLIGYNGGFMVAGQRGAVMGVIATMGVIVGSDVPMFLGAMIVGPLAAVVIKAFDKMIDGKIKPGFEMLVNNFSLGILGMILAILSFLVIGPVMTSFSKLLGSLVYKIVKMKLLPLVSLLVEPAKILFLNNAINHGVFTPLGAEQVAATGKSIFYLIETNPGPGLGVLLAYMIFGKGNAKESAPGAIIIHFLGGIHEIYFPYVLMAPALFLSVIAGGVTGVFINMIFNTGLVSVASPGSIIAIILVAAKDTWLGIVLSVTGAALASFLVSIPIIKKFNKVASDDDLSSAQDKISAMKNSVKTVSVSGPVRKIIVACDAGLGSSAMGAGILNKKLKEAGLDIVVTNSAIDALPDDVDIVITQKTLMDRVMVKVPGKTVLAINNFMDSKFYDTLIEELSKK